VVGPTEGSEFVPGTTGNIRKIPRWLGTTTDALSAGFAKLTLSFGTFAVLNERANESAHCAHSVEEM